MKNTVLHSLVARGKRCCAVLSGDRATRLCHVSHRSYQVIIGMMTSGDVTTDVTPAEPGGENMIARGNMRTNTQLRPAWEAEIYWPEANSEMIKINNF